MTLSVRLLGPVQISRDEQPISVRGYKPVALLAYLLVTGVAHTRQHLVDLLFDGPDDPKASLRWTLSELRRAIGAEYILADRQQIVFNFEGDYWLDVTDFEAGQSDLYRGDFLEGLNVRDAFGFEEWTLFERERLKGIYQAALTRRLETSESGGDDQAVIETAHKLLSLDNLREGRYRALMRAYARQGQREAALAQFDLCRQVLKTELGVEPGADTVALAEAIRQGTIETTPDVPPTPLPPRPPAPLHTLRVPPQPTPFIGREAELTALDDLIADPSVRMVTIVGLGGMGKTRLALALAEKVVGSERQLIRTATVRSSPGAEPTLLFPNGVFFVSLAPLSGVDQIVPTIAQALDFRLETGQTGGLTRKPQQQLLDYLHQKRLLLILDNLEHLLSPPSEGEENGGSELLAQILQTAPGIQILATSRERLNLREEHIYSIQGLEFPDWETPVNVAHPGEGAEYAAAKLFLQSARRVRPNFELVADDLPYLTRICRLVEGMPLGIELAASWVDMLSLADIAAEIQQGLDFLEKEVRNVPERHRSIRAVFDTSWGRLSEAEQDVFAQLSVFRGGFTREAAQEVTATREGLPASLRMLATLSNKSLLGFG
jgi:predicted ATPase/DNA-binding SARP family transcriptional activator